MQSDISPIQTYESMMNDMREKVTGDILNFAKYTMPTLDQIYHDEEVAAPFSVYI